MYKAGQKGREDIALSTQETWRRCVSYSSSFVHEYIAYHHYRSKVGVI